MMDHKRGIVVALVVVCLAVIGASNNIVEGDIGSEDVILHRTYVRSTPLNIQQSQDVQYQGTNSDIITAVRATNIGSTSSSARIIRNGIGTTSVNVRFISEPNSFFYYVLDIWGKGERVPNSDLVEGTIGEEDILLMSTSVEATAIHGKEQTQRVNYGHPSVVVTAVRAIEQGDPQGGSARIYSAGIGWTGINIEFKSAPGRGYRYQLDVYGYQRFT